MTYRGKQRQLAENLENLHDIDCVQHISELRMRVTTFENIEVQEYGSNVCAYRCTETTYDVMYFMNNDKLKPQVSCRTN